jgi:hypothetical protein
LYLCSLDPFQRIPSFLRFFRDSAIVDIGFTITFTIVATICARRSATRALLCEQLSRQPELLRNLANSGLNFENCEQWFEDVVLVFVVVMAVSILMRVRTPVFAYALCGLFLNCTLRSNSRLPSPISTHVLFASNDSIAWLPHSTATRVACSSSHLRSRPTTESWCMPPYRVQRATQWSLVRPRPGSPIPVEAIHRAYERARFASPSCLMRVCFLADHRRRLQNDWHNLVFTIT